MAQPQVHIEPSIESQVRLGLIHVEPVSVGQSGPELTEEIEQTCKKLVCQHTGKSPGEIPGLGPARELYRAFGVDPTKTRPSSEAMLRRLLKEKPFPRISNAVDLCNLCALKFLLSLGLYDADRIQGEVTLRRGREGETFAGIRKDQVNVQGRLVLADQEGPFGNPTSDSLRTSVNEDTKSLWMVIFAPASFPQALLARHVETSCADMARHLSATGQIATTSGNLLP